MDELNYLYIYYMNDEQKPVTVQINHLFWFDPNNPFKQPDIEYHTLQACEARIFKVEAPENSIPYVKKWQNKVLLSYLPADQVQALTHSTSCK
jgi:hypothetical protein